MFDKLFEYIWVWLRQQWGLISAVPVPFAACVLVSSALIGYLVYWFLDARYTERISVLQATVQFQAEQLTDHRNKRLEPEQQSHRKSEPKLMLSMSGGNVFLPDAPDLRDRLTGIHIAAQVWNTGTPSVATEWSLIIAPEGTTPVIAQLTRMPELLRVSGAYNGVVLHGSDALDVRTKVEPVGDRIIEGPLLFYVPLPKDVVMEPHTRLELSVKDINGVTTAVTKVMGDWLSR